jgi:putative flippase GtrA
VLTPIAPATTTRSGRWVRFAGIGLLGLLLQLTTLWLLTSLAHWRWLVAAPVSVELAVAHNFLWHVRWTWRDRSDGGWLARFVRFQLANGFASIAGNAALMVLFSGGLGWRPLPASACAVAAMAGVNFFTADRWVFRRSGLPFCAALSVACVWTPASAAAQSAETIAAWHRCIAATEARLERSRTTPRPPSGDAIAANGESVSVPSGTISDWSGSVFVRGITLDRLLQRLQHPGTPPPQEDIVSSQVLARTDDSLRVSIRLVRRAIVTVTYDTEHEMRFHRWTARLATARSVATRIDEAGGSDHGFLWRLHSYWRYEETDGGVRVDVESLTLSRDVPSLIRPFAAPLVTRIARESMMRTLQAFQRFFNTEGTTGAEKRPCEQTGSGLCVLGVPRVPGVDSDAIPSHDLAR